MFEFDVKRPTPLLPAQLPVRRVRPSRMTAHSTHLPTQHTAHRTGPAGSPHGGITDGRGPRTRRQQTPRPQGTSPHQTCDVSQPAPDGTAASRLTGSAITRPRPRDPKPAPRPALPSAHPAAVRESARDHVADDRRRPPLGRVRFGHRGDCAARCVVGVLVAIPAAATLQAFLGAYVRCYDVTDDPRVGARAAPRSAPRAAAPRTARAPTRGSSVTS